MGIESVKKFFKENNLELEIIETAEKTGTVEEAAKALGVEPDMIAKTMGYLMRDGSAILILSKGKARTDNRKFKDVFKEKPKMIPLEEVYEITGHPIGGVCPFGLKKPLKIYLDITLKEFKIVYPAGGTSNSAVKITPDYLQKITNGIWIDISK